MDATLRRSVYSIMLIASTGMMVARVANVELLYEPSVHTPKPNPDKPDELLPARKWPGKVPTPWPTFSSNDRARWATVKALVEDHTFVVGQRVEDPKDPRGYHDDGLVETDGFKSVDYVLHPDRQEFFSTKPPLLTLFVAGQYLVLHDHLKKDMVRDKWEVAVPILLVTNVLPLVLALFLLSRLIELYGKTDWGRLFVFGAACFGTFLPTFVTTLNNHVPAACCVVYALYALAAWSKAGNRVRTSAELREWYPHTGDDTTPEEDNPGSPMRLAIVGLFAGLAACLELPALAFGAAIGLIILMKQGRGVIWYVPALLLPLAGQAFINHKATGTWEPIYAKFGGPWYAYPGSHWNKPNLWEEGKEQKPKYPGIDFAEEPKQEYALHFLVGHHGLFSLTPLWVLALVGMLLNPPTRGVVSWLHRLTPLVAAVVIGFYIWKTNNYGGWTCGPRWLFWLTPLFLLAMAPAADALAKTSVGRGIAYLCLGASAFSATYPWANPWRHPWIYQLCEYMEWVRY
jgi:hypothetical protein